MKLNRKRLLQIVRGLGCKDTSSLDKIKAFLEEDGIDLKVTDEDGDVVAVDVDASWKNKIVQVTIQPDGVALVGDAGETFEVASEEEPEEPAEEPAAAPPEQASARNYTLTYSPDSAVAALQAENLRLRKRLGEGPASRIQGVNATIHKGGMTPQNHRAVSARKRYERKIAAGKAAWSDVDRAEQFGAWLRLTIAGVQPYDEKARDLDICTKANVRTQNSLGGALVPEEFEADIIELRETYGVAEQIADVMSLPDGRQRMVPRKTGEFTVYGPEEGVAITESNMTFDDVELTPKERKVYATFSNELMRDAALNMSDIATRGIAWAFAKDMDNAFFIGDGTSTYFGVTGLTPSLKNLSGTIANIAGLVVGTTLAYSGLTLGDFEKVQGRLPDLENVGGEPEWVVNKRFYHEVMQRLMIAQGGVTRTETEDGTRDLFLGSPVRFARSMPRTQAASQVCALYGWYDEGSKLGRVNGSMEIATSDQRHFDQDKIAIRGKHSVGITVHDVGNANATEASREPGPIVGLITAAA